MVGRDAMESFLRKHKQRKLLPTVLQVIGSENIGSENSSTGKSEFKNMASA